MKKNITSVLLLMLLILLPSSTAFALPSKSEDIHQAKTATITFEGSKLTWDTKAYGNYIVGPYSTV